MDNELRMAQRTGASPERMQRLLARSGSPRALRLLNARYGFATNSSSSHSVIVCDGLSDDLHNTDGALEYGWGSFTLASSEEKAKYIGVQMMHHYKSMGVGALEAAAIVRMFMPLDGVDNKALISGYVDHQSVMAFAHPRLTEQGMAPMWNMFRTEIVEREDIVILGGNDNSDGHPLESRGPEPEVYTNGLASRRGQTGTYLHDEETGHFTIFYPNTGKRVRFIPDGRPDPDGSSVPELVDVKLTNYCTMGCDYCYMDSTPEGEHASLKTLTTLACSLGMMGVFEVAIGGGEPTDHPDFAQIIETFAQYGVIPSFSTQSWRWLEDDKIRQAVADHCGAVALSTQNPEHVKPWIEKLHAAKIRPHFHYVLGLNPLSNLKKFLRAWGNTVGSRKDYSGSPYPIKDYYESGRGHLVLLGHKSMGRAQAQPHPSKGWGEVVTKVLDEDRKHAWTIAVDSFLTDEVPQELGGTDTRLYEASDGLYSMFIDAVEMTVAEHSFVPGSKRFSVGNTYGNTLKEVWAKLQDRTRQTRKKLKLAR